MPGPVRRAAAKAAAKPIPPRRRPAKTEPTPDDQIIDGEVIDQGQPAEKKPAGGLRTKDGSPLKKETVHAAGRDFVVSIPGEAQLAVMSRFAKRYSGVSGEVSLDQGIAMTDAAIAVIQAVLDDQGDKAWVETALLSGEVELEDLQPIVDKGMKRLIDANSNREQRRAASKGPKAKTASLASPE